MSLEFFRFFFKGVRPLFDHALRPGQCYRGFAERPATWIPRHSAAEWSRPAQRGSNQVRAGLGGLARPGTAEAPVLQNGARLIDCLTAALARVGVEQFRVLARETSNRPLELYTMAFIVAYNQLTNDPILPDDNIDAALEIRRATQVPGIALHDIVIIGDGIR